MHYATTADIPLPDDPLKTIIGQEEAVKIARVVAKQKRNMLLVGPPGTG
ncbi:MAG: ATP-binding protein, partial [Candidatus Micrarchaeota archaeon]